MSVYNNVLIAVSGSIAAYKTCELVSLIKKSGRNVKVVCTDNALKFVGAASFEGLSGEPVYSDTFEHGKMMSHIQLAKWADVFILAPAGLAQLGRMGSGIADNLITNIFFALPPTTPKYIAPAMNVQMWENVKTQDLTKEIKKQNVTIIEPGNGTLACGDVGPGRMAEALEIFTHVFGNTSRRKLKALISSGGTREAIDSVRFIGNHSTGRTGANLADKLQDSGIDITLIHASSAILPKSPEIKKHSFVSFKDLQDGMQKLITEQDYDLVIHAAAVSDFSLEATTTGKLDSAQPLTLQMKPNPKIISQLKGWAKPSTKIIGFKLTVNADPNEVEAAVKKVFAAGECDMVVHNDMAQITAGKHLFHVFQQDNDHISGLTLDELSNHLLTFASIQERPTNAEAQL